MNISWFLWFNRGLFHKRSKKGPLSGMLGDKKWVDTYYEKTGKSQHNEKDAGWDDFDSNGDDVIWRD